MKKLTLPPLRTKAVMDELERLGGRWNGIPRSKPGFGWEAPEEMFEAAQAHLDAAAERQNTLIGRSIARDMGNGADR